MNSSRSTAAREQASTGAQDLGVVANDICQEALHDATSQLHPLLQNRGLEQLDRRAEFLQAFRSALEQRIARALAGWSSGVQAVFRYDDNVPNAAETWDGSIHLLVKVPRLSDAVLALAQELDQSLVTCLQRLGWPRVRARQSVLEVHQVTPGEMRHGIGYGGMFFAVHTAPVKVWPQGQKRSS